MVGTQYQFGPFRLCPLEQLLLRAEERVPLTPKAFDLLVVLVENHGHLVTRERLMQALWPDSFVEETNLTVNISLLRKTLGELDGDRPWIATVPKRGYRFDTAVTVIDEGCAAAEEDANAAAVKAVLPVGGRRVSEPLDSPPERRPEKKWNFRAWNWLSLRRGWVVGAVAVLAIVSLGFWLMAPRILGRVSPMASVHTIAVLPFQQPGATPDDQYLGMGLTDALITRLGRLSQIVVRPIGAVRGFQKSSDPLAMGRTLDVQAVLDGTVQRIGDHTQVAVHLERVADGAILWSEQFDEQNTSNFEIEDSISQRLAKALTLRLSRDERARLSAPATPNSQAYELYIQGRYWWNRRSAESVQKSIDLFRQATEMDPNYAAAWSGLADAWILAGTYGNSFLAPNVAMPKAKQAAEKALALDELSAEAHTSLAYIHLMWDWDFAGAEREFRRALEINPGYVNAHHWYSHELIALGRVAESHEQSETALALDPADVVINEHMAWHHMMAREYSRSLPQAYKAVELDPSFVQAHRVLGLDLLYTGQQDQACSEFEKGVELSHGDPVAKAYLARCYGQAHREAEARRILPELEEASSERYISAAEIAAIYAALNDAQGAFRWLDKACEEHAGTLVYLNADRVWDPLRSDPRFQIVLRRVHLPASPIQVAAR